MAMTIDCDKLASKFNSPAATCTDGLADALNSQPQLQEVMFLKLEEAGIVPGMSLGNDFVKVPLPPPQPHSVQRPPKHPRFLPIPGMTSLVKSKGSVGHPFTCAAACRYVRRKCGCRHGSDCPLCHECVWSKTSTKDSGRREIQAKGGDAARSPVFVSSSEDLTDDFKRLLSTEACNLQPLLQQGSLPVGYSRGSTVGMESFAPPGFEMPQAMNSGSLGHPYSCGPACKYVMKSRGCKEGDTCARCHLCHWSRFSAKTLKIIEAVSEQ